MSENKSANSLFITLKNEDISESVRKHLQALAYQCPKCKYAAMHAGTMKYHLRVNHNISWSEYRQNFTDFCPGNIGGEFIAGNSGHYMKNNRKMDTELADFHRKKRIEKSRNPYNKDKGKNKCVCFICSERFSEKSSLQKHLKTQHKNDPRLNSISDELKNCVPTKSTTETECPFCEQSFNGTLIFSHMVADHTSEKSFLLQYKLVKKLFNRQNYLNIREEYIKPVVCPNCGIGLKSCSLQRHIANHCKKNLEAKKRFYCHLCSYSTLDKNDMQKHKAESHLDRKDYICEQCGASYKTSVGLRQHSRIKHGNVWKKPLQLWSCLECGKEFPSRLQMERHQTVHRGERRYTCVICGRKFKGSSSLAAHKRSIHEKVYRYHCDQCGHGMDRKIYLQSHKCNRVRKANIATAKNAELVRNSENLTPSEIHSAHYEFNLDGNTSTSNSQHVFIKQEYFENINAGQVGNVTYILQGSNEQVAMALNELSKNGSFVTMETEEFNEVGIECESLAAEETTIDSNCDDGCLDMHRGSSAVIVLPENTDSLHNYGTLQVNENVS